VLSFLRLPIPALHFQHLRNIRPEVLTVSQIKAAVMKIKASMMTTLERLGLRWRTDSRAQFTGTLVETNSRSNSTSKGRARFALVDDITRNERQKMVLLVEHRHLLGETSKRLAEESQELHTRTKKLIADARRDIKKKGKSA
jgi:hypothetical protein